ncbi:MAG: PAS domain-containing protein, partial [Limibacillus sp.]
RYRYANARYKQWFGVDPETMIGKTLREVVGEENYRALRPHMDCALQGQESRSEIEAVIPNMGRRLVRELLYPQTDEDGVVSGFVVLAEDITEQRQAEEELRQSQKLEAVDKLTGGIAHDFNNLLAVVLGNLESIKAAHDERGGDPALDASLEDAMRAAETSAELTKKLLSFGRRAPLHPEVVDPNAVLRGIERLLTNSVSERVTLRYRLQEGLRAVRVDPRMLENALLNLVINARDAVGEGGSVTVASGAMIVRRSGEEPRSDAPVLRLGPEARFLCHPLRDRRRRGNLRGKPGPDFRTLLHHQTGGAGLRLGALDGLRILQPVRWRLADRQPRRHRHRGHAHHSRQRLGAIRTARRARQPEWRHPLEGL